MFFSYQSAWSSPRQKLFLCKEKHRKNIIDIHPRGWKYRPSDNVCPARGDRVKCSVDSLLMGREYCWKLSPWMSGNWMFTLPTIYSKPPKDSTTIFHKKYYRLSWKNILARLCQSLGQSHGHSFMPQTLQIAPEKWGSFKRMIRFPPEFTKVIQTKWSMMSFWWSASLLWLEVSIFFSTLDLSKKSQTMFVSKPNGYGSIPINTIFSGMNIHFGVH